MADLSVYEPLTSVNDYRQQNISLNRKRQFEDEAMAIQQQNLEQSKLTSSGQDPAAVKIVNEMELAARAFNDPNSDDQTRAIAKHRYDQLNQVSKSYAIDKGMTPSMPNFGGQQPQQNIQIDQAMGGQPRNTPPELPVGQQPYSPQQGVQEAPGFADIQNKRSYEKEANKQQAELDFIARKENNKLLAKRLAEAPSAYNATEYSLSNSAYVIEDVNELLNHPGLEGATGFGGTAYSSLVSSTDAADFKGKLKTLKSKTFVNAIQAMRAASKTGGAVGQVNEVELENFQNQYNTMIQTTSPGQFRQELHKLIRVMQEGQQRIKASYDREYGGVAPREIYEAQTIKVRAEQEFQGKKNNNYKNKYGLE